MRLGLCCNPSEADAALAVGYDYVELPANSDAPSEATNLFFASGLRLYDDLFGIDSDVLALSLRTVHAAAERGVKIMVLGSGAARRADLSALPESSESFIVQRFERTFYNFAAALDRAAQDVGLRIAPESLNPGETNVGTSLPDLARALAAKGAPYTADSYHALVETGTRDADLAFWREQVPFAPIHVHFAPFDRSVPKGEEASLKSFFARLREIGYDDRASLECHRDGIPDPAPIRRLFE